MLQPTLDIHRGDHEKRFLEFMTLLESFARNLAIKGIVIQPWGPVSAQKFLSLPLQQQEKVFGHFNSYLKLIGMAEGFPVNQEISEYKEIYSEKDLLKVCARNLEVEFHSDIYTKITNEDIIEVYDRDLVQIYRNLGFFDLCSYSLLDLLSYEFYTLYERSLQVNSLMIEAGKQLIDRAYSLEPVSLRHISKHLMREKFSDKKISFMIEFKEMYPVYTFNRDFYGYLIIQGVEKMPNAQTDLFFI